MENLLKELLSDTVALKFKAQGYHWNVKGRDFDPFHSFFSGIYSDYESAVDAIAEWLLKLDLEAPSDLLYFYNNTTVSEGISGSDGAAMAQDLLVSNDAVGLKFQNAVTLATNAGQHALANFFAERMDAHQKWHWQLKATIS